MDGHESVGSEQRLRMAFQEPAIHSSEINRSAKLQNLVFVQSTADANGSVRTHVRPFLLYCTMSCRLDNAVHADITWCA